LQINQRNRAESPDLFPNTYRNLINDVASKITGIKVDFLINATEHPFEKIKIISISHTLYKNELQID